LRRQKTIGIEKWVKEQQEVWSNEKNLKRRVWQEKECKSKLQKFQKEKLCWLDNYIRLIDIIETQEDRQRLTDLIETIKKEKSAEAYQAEQQAKDEINK
jgi:hypothetical protein